jgi:hypothetical protein
VVRAPKSIATTWSRRLARLFKNGKPISRRCSAEGVPKPYISHSPKGYGRAGGSSERRSDLYGLLVFSRFGTDFNGLGKRRRLRSRHNLPGRKRLSLERTQGRSGGHTQDIVSRNWARLRDTPGSMRLHNTQPRDRQDANSKEKPFRYSVSGIEGMIGWSNACIYWAVRRSVRRAS